MYLGRLVKHRHGGLGIIIRASWLEPPGDWSSQWHCDVMWSDGSFSREDFYYLETDSEEFEEKNLE